MQRGGSQKRHRYDMPTAATSPGMTQMIRHAFEYPTQVRFRIKSIELRRLQQRVQRASALAAGMGAKPHCHPDPTRRSNPITTTCGWLLCSGEPFVSKQLCELQARKSTLVE